MIVWFELSILFEERKLMVEKDFRRLVVGTLACTIVILSSSKNKQEGGILPVDFQIFHRSGT